MQHHKIAVLHCITDNNFGGAGAWLSTFLTYADTKHFKYGIVLPKDSLLLSRLPSLNSITVFPLPIHEAAVNIADVPYYRAVSAAFAPDIVQSHGSIGARFGCFLAAPHASYIITKHCIFENARSDHAFLGSILWSAVAPFTQTAIATAACAKSALYQEGFPKKRIITVQNGTRPCRSVSTYEVQKFKNQYGIKNAFTVGFCGRLEEDKNPFFLLRVAARLQNCAVQFLVVGDGALRGELESRVRQLGMENRFIFTGYLNDVAPALSLFDVQLNCSILSETSNMAMLEGFSLGVPAVASSCGGNTEIVRDGINGIIYRKNDVAACAAAIQKLANNKPFYSRCSLAARALFERRHHGAIMTARCEKLYSSLCKKST